VHIGCTRLARQIRDPEAPSEGQLGEEILRAGMDPEKCSSRSQNPAHLPKNHRATATGGLKIEAQAQALAQLASNSAPAAP
jgi:hypothetical protein